MEKLTVEQLGALVKSKYPQYSAFSDKEIGKKTLAKHPEYANRVIGNTETNKGTLGRVKQSLNDSYNQVKQQIGGTGEYAGQIAPQRGVELAATITSAPIKAASELPVIKPVIGAISNVTGGIINWLGDKLGSTQIAQDFVMKHPEAAKTLENVAKTSGALTETTGNLILAKGAIDLTKKGGAKVINKAGNISEQSLQKAKDIFSGTNAKLNDMVLPISETVKTTLRRTTNGSLKKYVDQAQNAAIDQKAMTPLEMAGEKAVDALNMVQKRLSAIGKQKSEVLSRSVVSNKPMGSIAVEARRDILRQMKDKILDNADNGFVSDMLNRLKNLGSNPNLKQVDDFIDYAQEQLYKNSKNLTISVGDKTETLIRGVVRNLNEKVKKAAGSTYSKLNSQYSDIIDIRNQLNTALGTEANKGGAIMKRVFSPTDSGTKKLFADVKKLTNIDLVDEAVLAKFAMDVFGDVRQASILQQLSIPTQRGIIEKMLQAGGNFIGMDEFIKKATIKKASKIQNKP